MHSYRFYLVAALLLIGLTGCQERMTVVKAKLVTRNYPARVQAIGATASDTLAARAYSSGLEALASGDTTRAVQQFVQSLKTDSGNWSAYYMLGLLGAASGGDDCLSRLRSALQYAPPVDSIRSQIYVAMAACYERQTDLAFAEQNYWTALQLNPNSEAARAGLERVRSLRRVER